MPHAVSPRRRSFASSSAIASGERASVAGAEASAQGTSSEGAKLGNAKSKFGRSPFTSMTSTGTWARRASSIITVTRPVLPLPVIPVMTPWVTR